MIIPQKLFGVIGWPIGHTLSPLVHNTGFQALGLPCAYLAWPIQPERLGEFVSAMRLLGIMGCSVTIPHKIAILDYLDSMDEPARISGAANTLVWRDGALRGENTDIAGFLAPLNGIPVEDMSILLLGAGGAAHAAAAGLALRHCGKVRVASPGNVRQFELAEKFGMRPIHWGVRHDEPAQLIVNATPMGMAGSLENETPYDLAQAPGEPSLVYDLVYNPLETRLLREAAARGIRIISGLEMFFWQADAQFRLWTGLPLPAEARQALEKALGQS